MKKLLHALLAGALVLALPGCSCAPMQNQTSEVQTQNKGTPVSDEEFTAYLDEYLIKMCEQDYMTVHSHFVDPEKYGIDLSKCDITLGTLLPEQEDIDEAKANIEKLKGWDPSTLSKTNRQIYEAMLWEEQLTLDMVDEKFEYLTNILSPTGSQADNLVIFFSEYALYNEEDIEPLITLINDVPRFTDLVIDYTKQQAELDLFMIEYDSVMDSLNKIISSKDDSPVTESLHEEIDSLDLDKDKKKEWKEKIDDALQESFFPSYTKMSEELKKLKSQNKPIKGMSSLKNGKEYYELLLKHFSGTSQSGEEIRSDLQEATRYTLSRYAELISDESLAEDIGEEPKTPFKKVSEMIPFLEERYPAYFPIVDDMEYEIKPLTDEQSQEGVAAYFVVPPIDSTRPYEIRYNERDYGSDASSLSLYDTFAHEGVPGHMYQAQYNREHFTHPIQYFFSCMGMQEGYATYAASQTLPWTGVNENSLEVWNLSEEYSNYVVLMMDLQINYEGLSRDEFCDLYGEESEPLFNRLAQDPGTFFAYYYGSKKLNDLQTIAKEALGGEYDDVDFNTALLQAGNVNFDIIEENVQDYIDSVRMSNADEESELPSTRVNDGTNKPKPRDHNDNSMQEFE